MELWLLAALVVVILFNILSQTKSTNKKRQDSTDNRKYKGNLPESKRNRLSRQNHDIDDLATFTISYGQKSEKSRNKARGKWIPANESVTVNGLLIPGGNFYFGGQMPTIDGYRTEASLVDESLKVFFKTDTYTDNSLGYWPSYSSISPKCRGAFLNWLASNRDNPNTPVGYVFIYFYGLERRIVIDSIRNIVDDAEFKYIFNEVLRLQSIYGESLSFLRYSNQLLEVMCLLRPEVASNSKMESSPNWDSTLMRYRLSKTVYEGKPIFEELALAWLKFYPHYNLKMPARRCSYEFNEMFKRLYSKKYGDGMLVKPNKTRLDLRYYSASPSLGHTKITEEDLPDPSMLKGPTNKLIKIAEECVSALDSYSRYLGRRESSRSDITALLLLPDELNDIAESNGLYKFKKWAEETIEKQDGLVSVSELWSFTGLPLPNKLNKKEIDLIESLAEKCGFGIVPSREYHHARPDINGKYVLFKGGHGKKFNPSKEFHEMGMALRLGAMVAAVDEELDQSEISFLKQLIEHDKKLSALEKTSLLSYLLWRIHTPPDIKGLSARIKQLSPMEKERVSQIMIHVALADGRIEPIEIQKLEKLYALLGLDRSRVSTDIHHLATGKKKIEGTTTRHQVTERSNTDNDFHLDESLLAIHESQTKDVQSMLHAIFSEEEIEETREEEISEQQSDQNYQDDLGIDSVHYTLYEMLINKDMWLINEFDKLCDERKLLRSGAIETINDWSYDRVDAPVLEEESDAVYVDHEIVLELDQ